MVFSPRQMHLKLGTEPICRSRKIPLSLQGIRCSFGKTNEFDEVDLSKLPVDSHVRLAKEVDRPILRRSYSYSDGINEQTGQFDAGLIFIAFQKIQTVLLKSKQSRCRG